MFKYLAFIVLLAILVPVFVSAESISVGSSGDVYVNYYASTTNFAHEASCVIGRYYQMHNFYNTLIEFDVSPYAGTTIDNDYLRLRVFVPGGASPLTNICIERNTADWDEDTVTWNTKPGVTGTIYLPTLTGQGWWEIDVADMIQGFIDGTYDNYGFTLRKAAQIEGWFRIVSKESTNTTHRPQLVIEYTPNPTAINLLIPSDNTIFSVWNKGNSGNKTALPINGKTAIKVQPVAGGKATTNVDFTWEAATTTWIGNTTYDWECDDNADFSSPEHTTTGLTSEAHTQEFEVTGDETWYWRVTAIEDENNTETKCVADFNFDFDWESSVPSAFNLLIPSDNAVLPVEGKGSSGNETASLSSSKTAIKVQPAAGGKATTDIDFTWETSTTAGSGNITYNWECDDNADFSSPEHTATGLTSASHTESFTVTEDETWYWRVTAAEDAHSTETQCVDDFSFDFDWSSNIEAASLGEIKAEFK